MKELFLPNRECWTTFSIGEWGVEGNWETCGGFGILSNGRWEPPILAVYTWLKEGKCKVRVIQWKGELEDDKGDEPPHSPIHSNQVSLVSISYDPERVTEAESEQEAVDLANEYQGGEADRIAYVHNNGEVQDDEELIVETYINIQVDDHDAAINWIEAKVKEWISQREGK